MIGSFVARREESQSPKGPSVWRLEYQWPVNVFEFRGGCAAPSPLVGLPPFCVVEQHPREGWVVPRVQKADLGPFRTRKRAAEAWLTETLAPIAAALEASNADRWRRTSLQRKNLRLTETQAHRLYSVLYEQCGATLQGRHDVVYAVACATIPSQEYRFQGVLGFGGKIWNESDRFRVSAYAEHTGPEERVLMGRTNELLHALFVEFFGIPDASP